MVVRGVLSTHTGLTAEGQDIIEFSCPTLSERGGTEIHKFSLCTLSRGVITGYITRMWVILPVEGSSSSYSQDWNSITDGVVTSCISGRHSQSELINENDFGAMVSGTSCVGGTSDPNSTGGLAGTGVDNSGFGDEGLTKGARDQCSHAGIRQSEGEEGPSRRTISWSVKGDRGYSRRPIDKRTSSSLRVILGIAIYNSRIYTVITCCLSHR